MQPVAQKTSSYPFCKREHPWLRKTQVVFLKSWVEAIKSRPLGNFSLCGLWGRLEFRSGELIPCSKHPDRSAEVFVAQLRAWGKFGAPEVHIKQPETSACWDLSKRYSVSGNALSPVFTLSGKERKNLACFNLSAECVWICGRAGSRLISREWPLSSDGSDSPTKTKPDRKQRWVFWLEEKQWPGKGLEESNIEKKTKFPFTPLPKSLRIFFSRYKLSFLVNTME